jgi:hypothetical protein
VGYVWASADGRSRAKIRIEARIEIETTMAEAGEERQRAIRLTADNGEGAGFECCGCATEMYATEILKKILGTAYYPLG